MKKIEWNKVTWYSKLAAVVVFVATFWVGFFLGMQWVAGDANMLGSDDAVFVGGQTGAHCGGFIKDAPTCAKGYHCKLVVSRPDTGGTCVKD